MFQKSCIFFRYAEGISTIPYAYVRAYLQIMAVDVFHVIHFVVIIHAFRTSGRPENHSFPESFQTSGGGKLFTAFFLIDTAYCDM